MLDAPVPPWTLQEFEQFEWVKYANWAQTASITSWVLDYTGARVFEDPDYRKLLALENEPSPSIKVYLTRGYGDEFDPIQMTVEDFSFWAEKTQVPRAFLSGPISRMNRASMEYAFERDREEVTAVSVFCAWAPSDKDYYWFIARSDHRANVFNILVSLGPGLEIDQPKVMAMLNSNQRILLEMPLHLISLIIEAAWKKCRDVNEGLGRDLIRSEAQIGVSKSLDWIRSRRKDIENISIAEMNNALFELTKHALLWRAYTGHLRNFSSTLLDLLEVVERQRNPALFETTNNAWLARRARCMYEAEIMNKRLDGLQLELEYRHTLSQTLFQVLYNRIVQRDARMNHKIARAAKQDSSAMKTISILTLVYLPVTAVSAIFSGTMFDFGNWGKAGEQVASGGWWVFVLCAIVLTVSTVSVWYLWLYKSEKKMDYEEEQEQKKAKKKLDNKNEGDKESSEEEELTQEVTRWEKWRNMDKIKKTFCKARFRNPRRRTPSRTQSTDSARLENV